MILNWRDNTVMPLLMSVLAHAVLIALVITRLHMTINAAQHGLNQPQILAGYLYRPPAAVVRQVTPIRKEALAITKVKREKHKVTPAPAKKETNKVETKTPPARQQAYSRGDGKPVPALLTLLHSAIAAHQVYPPAALAMEREGRTTLMFRLYTNGTIDDLHIIKSSGTNSLDAAALAAVNQAVPFKSVNKYLHKAQEYQIDVVFELT